MQDIDLKELKKDDAVKIISGRYMGRTGIVMGAYGSNRVCVWLKDGGFTWAYCNELKLITEDEANRQVLYG